MLVEMQSKLSIHKKQALVGFTNIDPLYFQIKYDGDSMAQEYKLRLEKTDNQRYVIIKKKEKQEKNKQLHQPDRKVTIK